MLNFSLCVGKCAGRHRRGHVELTPSHSARMIADNCILYRVIRLCTLASTMQITVSDRTKLCPYDPESPNIPPDLVQYATSPRYYVPALFKKRCKIEMYGLVTPAHTRKRTGTILRHIKNKDDAGTFVCTENEMPIAGKRSKKYLQVQLEIHTAVVPIEYVADALTNVVCAQVQFFCSPWARFLHT